MIDLDIYISFDVCQFNSFEACFILSVNMYDTYLIYDWSK